MWEDAIYRKSVNFQCHYCDVSWDDLSEPFCKFKYNVDKTFFDLARKNKSERLHILSHYCIHNAFEGVNFGEDEDMGGGIHRWTPAEVLHYLMHGLNLYAIQGTSSVSSQSLTEVYNGLFIRSLAILCCGRCSGLFAVRVE